MDHRTALSPGRHQVIGGLKDQHVSGAHRVHTTPHFSLHDSHGHRLFKVMWVNVSMPKPPANRESIIHQTLFHHFKDMRYHRDMMVCDGFSDLVVHAVTLAKCLLTHKM